MAATPATARMASSQSTEPQWIACPNCHIASLSTSVRCESCGAQLYPGSEAPGDPRSASPPQWALFIGILGFLIGTAIWAAISPNSIAARMYGASLPALYCVVLLYGFGRAFLRFRRRDFSGGFTGLALTILFALAALPAVLDFNR